MERHLEDGFGEVFRGSFECGDGGPGTCDASLGVEGGEAVAEEGERGQRGVNERGL